MPLFNTAFPSSVEPVCCSFKIDEIKVFKEIDTLIDEKTKIVYTTSGYKSTIKRYSEIAEKKNISVLKRIIRSCR